jgi:hypothetical protein
VDWNASDEAAYVSLKTSKFGAILSEQIYSVQAVPLFDRDSQLAALNVPIILEPTIRAPWIMRREEGGAAFTLEQPMSVDSELPKTEMAAEEAEPSRTLEPPEPPETLETLTTASATGSATGSIGEPVPKRMKLVKVPRVYVENGYQMTEIVNELVPCDDNDPEAELLNPQNSPSVTKGTAKPTSAKATTSTSKQGNLLSFFKKQN